MDIIEYIENALKEQNISAYKLCKDTGIKQTTFQNWKNGSQPRADILKKVVIYLNLSADIILETGYNKENELTENEKELLNIFRRLPDREQIKAIGRLEDQAEKFAAAPDPDQQKFIRSGAGEETG